MFVGTPEQIRTLTEEWLETGNDRLLDEIDKLSECMVNTQRLEPRFVERYRCGGLYFHLNIFVEVPFSQRGRVERLPSECRQDGVTDVNRSKLLCACGSICHDDIMLYGCGDDRDQLAMFVDVVELVDGGERLINGGFIRLQPFDKVLSLRAHPAQGVTLKGVDEVLRLPANRKNGVSCGRGAILDNQLPCEMIEGAAEVMHTVANDVNDGRINVSDVQDVMRNARVRIYLTNDLVLSGTLGLKPFGYVVEVETRSFDFELRAVK